MRKPVKEFGRLCLTAVGFLYDLFRYVRHGGWRVVPETSRRYHLAKVSHSVEKSMAFEDQRPESGWGAVRSLAQLLLDYQPENPGFADLNAADTLLQFIEGADPELRRKNGADQLFSAGNRFGTTPAHAQGGVRTLGNELSNGQLPDPETFFNSRYSLRTFQEKPVDRAVIERAVRLAMKSPTACNRQPWHVYHSDNRETIKLALSYQTGNRGFGHKVPNLIIVSMDISAFVSANERYQHWIDGGMFAMSLVWALHALGVGSCCLNWSKLVKDDVGIRRAVNIPGRHAIIMMIAAGYPKDQTTVCKSTRRPLTEVWSDLEQVHG